MTVKLTIKLFGTLGLKIPDYNHDKGIMIDAPDNVTPADLLKDLQVPLSHVGFISCENRSIKADTPLSDGMVIHFYSLVSGG
ncbi:MAG: hypothetical protein ABFR31_01155 [Thermodesulfobacteriota bacterium]